MKYTDIKKEIYGYYNHIGKVDIDNIQDANDHIIDEHIDQKRLENSNEEFYITVSMCVYMIEHNVYDEYFFEAFKELYEEFNNASALLNNVENELKNDTELIDDYIKKDEINKKYYENLSDVYNNQIKKRDDIK